MCLIGKTTFFETRNLKVLEFALFNPFIGYRKSAILEKNRQLSVDSGKDCWKQMNSRASPPIYFEHCDKHHVVYGGYTDVYGPFVDFPGKSGCQT